MKTFKEYCAEAEHTATYVKTPTSAPDSKTTIFKNESDFLAKAKELHGEITKKNKSNYHPNDTATYHNKEGKLIGMGGGNYDNKNWAWKLHSKPIEN